MPMSASNGFDTELNSFVQFYGSKHLDASLLMMAIVGFLPANDPRIRGTVEAIEKHLLSKDGFVNRYTLTQQLTACRMAKPPFFPALSGWRTITRFRDAIKDAREVFERVLAIRNDLGLLSEEYDPVDRRLLGNFPQAFSHFGMVNTAFNLEGKPPGKLLPAAPQAQN